MRFIFFFMVYGAAVFVGFFARQRYDEWMFRKPHMQQRLRVFAAEIFSDPDPVGTTDYLPPSTTDQLALSPRATAQYLEELAASGAAASDLEPGVGDVPQGR